MNIRHVYVTQQGTRLGKTGERLVVKLPDDSTEDYSLVHLRSILISVRGVSVSTDLMVQCAQRDISLEVLDFDTTAAARLTGKRLRKPGLLRAQVGLSAADSLNTARALISEQVVRRRSLLRYLRRSAVDPSTIERSCERMSRRLDQVRSAHSIAQLMGLEGSCARAYWRGIATTVDTGVFETRIGRGAKDTSNAMLNYGYAVLRSRILGMVERVGLEPTIGFLHSDREGRVSLVLDLMEPWRVIVEDAAFSLLRRHAGRFESQRQATRMTADAVVARLEAEPDGEASTV